MTTEKTCKTCRFRNKGDASFCLAEACYAGDMWEPEETQSPENVQNLAAFSKGDCETIYNDFMKGME